MLESASLVSCGGCGVSTQSSLCCPKCAEYGGHSVFCSQSCFSSNYARHCKHAHVGKVSSTQKVLDIVKSINVDVRRRRDLPVSMEDDQLVFHYEQPIKVPRVLKWIVVCLTTLLLWKLVKRSKPSFPPSKASSTGDSGSSSDDTKLLKSDFAEFRERVTSQIEQLQQGIKDLKRTTGLTDVRDVERVVDIGIVSSGQDASNQEIHAMGSQVGSIGTEIKT